MSRSYSVKPQKNFVYTVEGLMELYEVSRNTVSNWVSEGLRRSDSSSPYIFNGMDVARFHDARKLSTHVTLRVGQFKCFTCKGRVFPEAHSIKSDPADSRGFPVSATCPSCRRIVFKRFNKENFDLLGQCIVTNTSLASIDESIDQHPASVGKVEERCFTANDRYIHAWLQFAGRHDKKTINAHLASIRDFENFCSGKRFNRITISDVTGYRDYLKSKVAERCLGVSTVKHRASHVKSLIDWLINQKQFWNLDKTLSSYLDLPKMFDASTLDQDDKPVPTIDEAVQMIQAMPTDTRKNRRDQAMVSTAFLGALRANTVTTLLIGHVKMDTKQLVQDGRSSRTKNGKSLRIWFFPIPSIFPQILGAWKNEMLALGFNNQDALFPDNQVLSCPFRPHNAEAVPAMR